MLTTTVIGSAPQPDWLLDRVMLRQQRVPRVNQPGLWRVDSSQRIQAIEDATRVVVREMEDAGVDVITDGEIGRESYSNHFLAALDGVDLDNPAIIKDRKGRDVLVPRVVGPVRRLSFCERRSALFLRGLTSRQVKVTLPGPFTLAQQCRDEHYHDLEALAFAFAEVVNEEARDLAAVGINVVQIDEPWFRNDPAAARRYGVPLVNRAFEGVEATSALHMCFGYGFLVPGAKPSSYEFLAELAEANVEQISIEAAQPGLDLGVLQDLTSKTIMLGVLNLSLEATESVEVVSERIRQGLKYLAPEKLMPAPDCGMKYLTRAAAREKLKVLVAAAHTVRQEMG